MIFQQLNIQVKNSMPYARLDIYIQSHTDEIDVKYRPLVLVCPGGGYSFTSEREADAIAMQFLAMGCHTAVLHYSVAPAQYPTALTELAYSMKLLRQNAEEWHINNILVLGCSAGGHLVASLGVYWEDAYLKKELQLEESEIIKPDGMILCYPVITSGEYAHRGSFNNLLGSERCKDPVWLDKLSLEKHVTANTPPTFIWHTFTDGSVPVENSLLFVSALRKAGVNTEFHMYPVGIHGLALSNRLTVGKSGMALQPECESWIGLVKTWIDSKYW